MSDGLTVKERIALLKQKSGANEGSSAPKPEPKRTVGKINSPFANRGGDVKNEPTKTESQVPVASCASNATSIAERIAAMKVSGGEIFQSTGDSSSGNNNVTMASDEPPVSGDESAHKNISVAEKIAALKSQSATPPPAPQQSVSMSTDSEKFHPPIVPTAVNTTGAASESDDAKPTPEKRGSIADRIAAMQSFGSSSKPQGQSVPAPAADVTSTPTARKGSIADKIAALKASSAAKCAESQGTPPGSGGTGPAPKSSRRLSGDRVAFAAGINLAGFNPNSPRPPFALPGMMSPKPVGGGRSGDGDGGASERMDEDEDADGVADHRSRSSTESSMKHMSMSRPSVPSVRRRRATSSVRITSMEYAAEDGVDVKDILASTSATATAADVMTEDDVPGAAGAGGADGDAAAMDTAGGSGRSSADSSTPMEE